MVRRYMEKATLVIEIRRLAREIKNLAGEIIRSEEKDYEGDSHWWLYPLYSPEDSGWYLAKMSDGYKKLGGKSFEALYWHNDVHEIEGKKYPAGWDGVNDRYVEAFKKILSY